MENLAIPSLSLFFRVGGGAVVCSAATKTYEQRKGGGGGGEGRPSGRKRVLVCPPPPPFPAGPFRFRLLSSSFPSGERESQTASFPAWRTHTHHFPPSPSSHFSAFSFLFLLSLSLRHRGHWLVRGGGRKTITSLPILERRRKEREKEERERGFWKARRLSKAFSRKKGGIMGERESRGIFGGGRGKGFSRAESDVYRQ